MEKICDLVIVNGHLGLLDKEYQTMKPNVCGRGVAVKTLIDGVTCVFDKDNVFKVIFNVETFSK